MTGPEEDTAWDQTSPAVVNSDHAPTVRGTRPTASPIGMSLTEFMQQRRPRWLVDGLLIPGEVTLLVGPPKAGKSAAAQRIAWDFARGAAETFGHRIHQSGAVFYLAGEGRTDLRFRVDALVAACGSARADGIRFAGRSVTLIEGHDDVPLLIEDMRSHSVGLLVVDTLARVLSGDENSAADVGRFLRAIELIIAETGAAILLLHHHRKAGATDGDRVRGSSAIRAAADVVAEISRRDGPYRVVRVIEARSRAEGDWAAFRLGAIAVPGSEDGDDAAIAVPIPWSELPKREAGGSSPARRETEKTDDVTQSILAAMERSKLSPGPDDGVPQDAIGVPLAPIKDELRRLNPKLSASGIHSKLRDIRLPAAVGEFTVLKPRSRHAIWLQPATSV